MPCRCSRKETYKNDMRLRPRCMIACVCASHTSVRGTHLWEAHIQCDPHISASHTSVRATYHEKPFQPCFFATSNRFFQSLQQYASAQGFPSMHEQDSILCPCWIAMPARSMDHASFSVLFSALLGLADSASLMTPSSRPPASLFLGQGLTY